VQHPEPLLQQQQCRFSAKAAALELIPLSADQSFSNLAASAEPLQQQSINNP
jgi:hypothetical protein